KSWLRDAMSTSTIPGNSDWVIDLSCVSAIDGICKFANGMSTREILYIVILSNGVAFYRSYVVIETERHNNLSCRSGPPWPPPARIGAVIRAGQLGPNVNRRPRLAVCHGLAGPPFQMSPPPYPSQTRDSDETPQEMTRPKSQLPCIRRRR